MVVGLIGGTGVGSPIAHPHVRRLSTVFGEAEVECGKLPTGADAAFVYRHGRGRHLPPHRLPYAANLAALRELGVDAVFSINNAGSLRPEVEPGHVLVPDDFLDWGASAQTIFHDEAVHVDLTRPYCPHLRASLVAALRETGWMDRLHPEGVYVQTPGPRLETPAETRHLATLGHVVGMTGAREAVAARELGLCYASLCFVANPAAQGSHGAIQAGDVRAALARASASLHLPVSRAAGLVPDPRACDCRAAPGSGRLS